MHHAPCTMHHAPSMHAFVRGGGGSIEVLHDSRMCAHHCARPAVGCACTLGKGACHLPFHLHQISGLANLNVHPLNQMSGMTSKSAVPNYAHMILAVKGTYSAQITTVRARLAAEAMKIASPNKALWEYIRQVCCTMGIQPSLFTHGSVPKLPKGTPLVGATAARRGGGDPWPKSGIRGGHH